MKTTPLLRLICNNLFPVLGAMLLLSAAPLAVAQDKGDHLSARSVMESVTQHVLATLRDPNLSAEKKRDQVKQIAGDNIDFQTMGRLSLGRPWKDITDDQRTRYSQVFKEHVTNTYGHTTDNYNNEDVNVTGDQKESDGDDTVHTEVVGGKDGNHQEVTKVDYRLRQRDGQWKVIDFSVDGVSLISSFRTQFQDVMTNGGIEQLIKLLQQKVTSNDK